MKQDFKLTINGETQVAKATPDTPLLWVLRDAIGLTGAKYGCGVGICGACTVHIDGAPVRSCVLPVEAVGADQSVQTIEGVAAAHPDHPVLQAWRDLDVPQCGYCQTGQIMAAIAFLAETPDPSPQDIRDGMANYCRCGTYNLIASAIERAAELSPSSKEADL